MYPDNGDSASLLKQQADNAMHRAKEIERNQFQFFTEQMHEDMLHRMYLESQLHLAIERDELFLVYQPQLNIHTNQIIGVEALLRWNHQRLGMISPAEFIPIAEESGLIQKIGQWVLLSALKQAGEWKTTLKQDFVVAINLSAAQFRTSNLVENIQERLQAYGLNTSDIELEITESTAMQDLNYTIKQMNKLSAAGIQLSMDDFGTGFSSLSSLKKFPITKLKIDKSFIDEMLDDTDDEAIVDTIITLSQTLGLTTIAEGVEEQLQLEALKRKGCQSIQGYLFSKPLPANEVLELVQNHPA
jgi:EAL domain-containing protein (putative c-di-GMP-specific phosphodiesterase class I)